MRVLAEFVMRGRLQALLVVVVGAGSPPLFWLSAAALALVTLRRGPGEGAWLLLLALLSAGILLRMFADAGADALLLAIVVPAVLVATTLLAVVLRQTVNLPLTLLASVAAGLLSALALVVSGEQGEGLHAQVVAAAGQFNPALQEQLAAMDAGAFQVLFAGGVGVAVGTLSVLCLLLARWWQAMLYNPGGFAEEFRALYFPPLATLGLLVPAAVLTSLGLEYVSWMEIFLIPFSFAGLALVHAWSASRGMGRGVLTVFYLLWLFLSPVRLAVVGFAIADSWLRFRQRWDRGNTDRD